MIAGWDENEYLNYGYTVCNGWLDGGASEA